ncbi:MAG: metallophosphoesterase [Alphaproteobacteria bacterium]|nr:metallophosphoesterase [Alphaproteobacteria bacterium]
MGVLRSSRHAPTYLSGGWNQPWLPTEAGSWTDLPSTGDEADAFPHGTTTTREIKKTLSKRPWVFPRREHFFLSDQHADVDAFVSSLVATGGVARTGVGDLDFALSEIGRNAVFVIGGDCFDKGPSNLRLLRGVRHLIDLGARVELLAGNHDLRTYVGLACAERTDPLHAHLFVRMGRKAIPLFKEIFDAYIGSESGDFLTENEVRRRLFPSDAWYDAFPVVAKDRLTPRNIEKELKRIREKCVELEKCCLANGMTLGQLHAAVMKARDIFLSPDGDFSWFFRRIKLVYRSGSFLYLHAGLDDEASAMLRATGVEGINAAFREALKQDLFTLYNGPLGNVLRTKYRDSDLPFSKAGATDARAAGVHAVVHGHRNHPTGQRLTTRHGLLNVECDASVDAGTRSLEGLNGPGAAATIIKPSGAVIAVSADHPLIKVLDFRDFQTTILVV